MRLFILFLFIYLYSSLNAQTKVYLNNPFIKEDSIHQKHINTFLENHFTKYFNLTDTVKIYFQTNFHRDKKDIFWSASFNEFDIHFKNIDYYEIDSLVKKNR